MSVIAMGSYLPLRLLPPSRRLSACSNARTRSREHDTVGLCAGVRHLVGPARTAARGVVFDEIQVQAKKPPTACRISSGVWRVSRPGECIGRAGDEVGSVTGMDAPRIQAAIIDPAMVSVAWAESIGPVSLRVPIPVALNRSACPFRPKRRPRTEDAFNCCDSP